MSKLTLSAIFPGMTHDIKRRRGPLHRLAGHRLPLAVAVLIGAALSGCGGGDGDSDNADAAREALNATGLTDTEIDCVLEEADITPEEFLDLDSAGDSSDPETAKVLDAFAICVNAEGDTQETSSTTAAPEESDEDEAALRAQIIAAGLTEPELDCILESTDYALADLVELETLLGTVDEEAPSASDEAAFLACFGASADGNDEDAAAQEDVGASSFTGDCAAVDGPCSYGDDPTLDALWDECAATGGTACDDLFFDSPAESEYEHFGDTCGERGVEDSCAAVYENG